jgi:hypothetical protein
MTLRHINKTSPCWVVFDEIGGHVEFHVTQKEAHTAGKERGSGRTIIYVAQILLTNDSAQWAESDQARRARLAAAKVHRAKKVGR